MNFLIRLGLALVGFVIITLQSFITCACSVHFSHKKEAIELTDDKIDKMFFRLFMFNLLMALIFGVEAIIFYLIY